MNGRIAKAIILAPLAVFPVMTALAWSIGWAAPIIGFFAVMFAYIGMLVIGIPSMLLLSRYHATQWWQLTLAGAIAPACVVCLGGEEFVSFGSLSSAAFGALVAGVAWFIAFRKSPMEVSDFE